MTKILKIGKLFVLLVIAAGFFACDDDDVIAPFELIGDVFTSKRMIDDEVKYARMYFAYGNQEMASAQVEDDGGNIIQLEPTGQSTVFAKEPDLDDYTSEFQGTGVFSFTAIAEGIEYTATDELDFNNLEIPVISSAEFSQTSQTVMVEWETVDGADSYLVVVLDGDGETVFVGVLVNSEADSYEISSASGTWVSTPEDGITYSVEVRAFEYEYDATDLNFTYNIQEVAIASQEIVWGQ